MDEREPLRSWDEICRGFPDEWVVLHDLELDPYHAIRRARVAGHARSSREVVERTQDLPLGREVAIRFTGERRDRANVLAVNLRW